MVKLLQNLKKGLVLPSSMGIRIPVSYFLARRHKVCGCCLVSFSCSSTSTYHIYVVFLALQVPITSGHIAQLGMWNQTYKLCMPLENSKKTSRVFIVPLEIQPTVHVICGWFLV